jgi:hypothetical protein
VLVPDKYPESGTFERHTCVAPTEDPVAGYRDLPAGEP